MSRWSSRVARVAAIVAFVACSGIDNVDVESKAKAVIPKGTLVDQLIDTLDLDAFQSVDFSNELANQGVSKSDVDSVRLTSFTLQIDAPPGQTFDFLDTIAFFAASDGLSEVRIAHLDVVPKGATKLTLEADAGIELKPYVVAPKMRIRGQVKGTRPPQETTISARVVLDVDVSISGC
jgi:hypothetical protein